MYRQPEIPALQVPQRSIDGAQRFYGEPLLAMVAQAVAEALPMKLGCQGIRSYQERVIKLDDRRGQKGRAECFTPATQPVLTDDLDQQSSAVFVPGLRIGERLRQCGSRADRL
jgi:hypothetical protein